MDSQTWAAAVSAGSLGLIVGWASGQYGVDMPKEVAGAFGALLVPIVKGFYLWIGSLFIRRKDTADEEINRAPSSGPSLGGGTG